jgi:hypothetical protein
MRMFLVAAGLVAATAVTALSVASYEADASPGKCLRFRDMTHLSRIDDRTLMAHTRSSAKYIVTLRHTCRDFGYPGNYYSFRLHSDTECFDRDDVLVFRYGGSCFVESVKPAPAT